VRLHFSTTFSLLLDFCRPPDIFIVEIQPLLAQEKSLSISFGIAEKSSF